MWLGWSSRVRFPEAKTDDSLSNVSVPSGAGYCAARPVRRSAASALGWVSRSFGGSFPFVTVIALARAPPMKKPLSNACRMFRTSSRSFHT